MVEEADLPGVAALLTEGFRSQRRRAFWDRALARLARHPAPDGFPRFGYLLEHGADVVGVLLLIFTCLETGPEPVVRCSVSSWHVRPAYQPYAALLVTRALRHREATYVNLTAVPHTFPILEAQGYARYCQGQFVAVPLLRQRLGPLRAVRYRPDLPSPGLSEAERQLLADHAGDGCVSLVGIDAGRHTPFVFAPRRKYGLVGLAMLAYCRDVAEVARFAGPLGRALAARGFLLVAMDADAEVPGLAGVYRPNKPKFFRGPHRPRPGDMAYSERTMFGS